MQRQESAQKRRENISDERKNKRTPVSLDDFKKLDKIGMVDSNGKLDSAVQVNKKGKVISVGVTPKWSAGNEASTGKGGMGKSSGGKD